MAAPKLPPLPADKGVWDDHAIDRRGFLEAAFGVLAGMGALLVAVPGVRFLVGNSLDVTATKWVELPIKVADLAPGVMAQMSYNADETDEWRAVVQRGIVYVSSPDGGNTFSVLDGTCTHLGCIVQWDQDKNEFVCPCHSGRFTHAGEVISGPPPRRLRQMATKVQDGSLFIEI
ncbi:MAG: ubiquinol-cytochrome c reductase iron-sulfur subunit [Chloroflexales bacterium]